MAPYADRAPALPELSPTLTANTATPAALPKPSELLPPTPALPELSPTLTADTATPAALPEPSESLSPVPALPELSPTLTANTTTPAALPEPSESLLPLPADLLQFNGATHAEQNPDGPTQPTRSLTKLTDVQKVTRKIRQETERHAQDLLSKELDQLLSDQRKELEDLAGQHGKKLEAIRKLISTSSHYKHKRSVNIENAKIHMKSQEINASRSSPPFLFPH